MPVWDFWLVYLPESICDYFALSIKLLETLLLWAVVWVMDAQWLDPGWASELRIANPWPCAVANPWPWAAWEAVWYKKHKRLCPVWTRMISKAGPSLWKLKRKVYEEPGGSKRNKKTQRAKQGGWVSHSNGGAPEEGSITCHASLQNCLGFQNINFIGISGILLFL